MTPNAFKTTRLLLMMMFVALAAVACGDLEDGEACDPETDGATCVCTDETGAICDPAAEDASESCLCAIQSDGSTTGASTAETVTIMNLSFDPKDVTISVGGTVTWVNSGNMQHNVRAKDASGADVFDETLNDGQMYTHTFTAAGVYAIDDRINASFDGLKGTVTVTE